MASLKVITVSLLGLAFIGFAVQLGGLASMADSGCRNASGGADGMPDYNEYSSSTLPTLNTAARRLLDAPTKFERAARCNTRLAMDWWSVFYQFAVIVFALFAAFTERMYQARVRVSLLFAVAIAWTVIQTSNRLPKVAEYTNFLRDNQVFEQDVNLQAKSWVNFISTRTYIAGNIIAAISYFFFVIFGLGEFSSA